MTTRQRIDLLARAYPRLFPRADLLRLVRAQLGHVDALDIGFTRDGTHVLARAPKSIYHVCAGNLAVSAFTSIAHGLVLGSHNVLKLPGEREDSAARKEILDFIRGLPQPLRGLVETQQKLDPKILRESDAVIAFGSDATIDSIRQQLHEKQKFLAHGHAVSLLWMAEPDRLTSSQARACAVDVLTYDQLGCLSPQAIYVPRGTDIEKLGDQLSRALEGSRRPPGDGRVDLRETLNGRHHKLAPRREVAGYLPRRSLGIASRIAEARDLAFALGHRVWLPPKEHLGWTIIHDPDPTFAPSPLHGVIIIRESSEAGMTKALAPVAGHISTIGVVGTIKPALRDELIRLGATRFCRAGRMQFPPLTWHHDGCAPLADLVTWVDLEMAE